MTPQDSTPVGLSDEEISAHANELLKNTQRDIIASRAELEQAKVASDQAEVDRLTKLVKGREAREAYLKGLVRD